MDTQSRCQQVRQEWYWNSDRFTYPISDFAIRNLFMYCTVKKNKQTIITKAKPRLKTER